MAYDPENDPDCLQCACNPDANAEDYPDGWDEYFRNTLVPTTIEQVVAEAVVDNFCPRASIRHAAARLAVAMAAIANANGERAPEALKTMLSELPGMMVELVADARPAVAEHLGDKSLESERRRGATAGFRRLN